MKERNNNPIFIIGTSRSGTELMSQVLNQHSDVSISQETHYFEDLRPKMSGCEQQSLNSEAATLCEDYFLALTHKIYGEGGNPEQGWMKRDELKKLANTIGQGTDSYFEAFCRIYATQNIQATQDIYTAQEDKIRWGEKTPRHVFRIEEIISCYPNAKFIYMLRHPGGVVDSYRNYWKLGQKYSTAQKNRIKNSYNILIISLIWKAAFKAALDARQKFGSERIYIQRFEDLINNPESSIQTLVDWLSLDYQSEMVEKIGLINTSYEGQISDKIGFIKQSVNRWHQQLNNREIAAIYSCCSSLLNNAGYDREAINPIYWIAIAWLWICLPFNSLKAIFANRKRVGKMKQYIWQRFFLAMLKKAAY